MEEKEDPNDLFGYQQDSDIDFNTDRDELTRIISAGDWHNIPPPIFSLFQNFAKYHNKKDNEFR